MTRPFGVPLLAATVVAALAALLFLGGALAGERPTETASGAEGPAISISLGGAATSAELDQGIASLQARLRRLPGDWQAWSALGAAYLAQARVTGDPSFYELAEAAYAESLQVRPTDNEPALTGQSALAAGRHDFTAALTLARRAVNTNPYSAPAHGALGDALVELGRYDDAFVAFQRMVDLKPGIPSYVRASYAWELRGDVPRARAALEQALAVAHSDADVAFVRHQLGDLAWSSGNLDAAAEHYAQGLRRDPAYVPLLAGRARVAVAQGRTRAALRDYTRVVQRLPQPAYLIELGDLYAALGRDAEAREQYELVATAKQLLVAADVNVDLELALYDADHGRPRAALRAARAEWKRRRAVSVEDAYGWALYANGRYEEALVHARRAERLGTRSATFAFHKGMIEKQLGMHAAARADLRRALRINEHFSVLHAARARHALREMKQAP